MRWDEADYTRFSGELLKIIKSSDPNDVVIDRLIARIEETLFLYGCPSSEYEIMQKMDTLLDFMTSVEEKRPNRPKPTRKREFLALLLARWVVNTVNVNAV